MRLHERRMANVANFTLTENRQARSAFRRIVSKFAFCLVTFLKIFQIKERKLK